MIGTTTFGASKLGINTDYIERVVYKTPGTSYLEPSLDRFAKMGDEKRQQILEASEEIQNEI
jgi:hypothetical protein